MGDTYHPLSPLALASALPHVTSGPPIVLANRTELNLMQAEPLEILLQMNCLQSLPPPQEREQDSSPGE